MRRFFLLVMCMTLTFSQLWAQTRTLTGKVTDESGGALVGATVSVPNSSIRTQTNSEGIFSINVPSTTKALLIRYVGYKDYTAPVTANATVVNASLTISSELEDVVITGISRVRRSQYSGATTKIGATDIENRPVGSFDQLFQGRVPGLTALTGSGLPGGSTRHPTRIIIRGQSSITGGFDPLYIVDGIPVETQVFQGLNPNDFESIDILRDANAAALYGSRGSAGVIVVTTKRGQAGRMKLSYDGQVGVKSRPQFTLDMMNTEELLRAQEAYGRILNVPQDQGSNIPGWIFSKNNPAYNTLQPTTAGSFAGIPLGGYATLAQQQAVYSATLDSLSQINTNWRDAFMDNGNFSNHQITLSGGTGRTRIYSSLGMYSEEGITQRSDMKRITLRNNIDFADDRFTLSVSTNLGYVKRNFTQSEVENSLANPFFAADDAAPYLKAYNADGTLSVPTPAQYAANSSYYTANAVMQLLEKDKSYSDQLKATVGVTTSYRITNKITAGLTAGIDFRETQASAYGDRTAVSRVASTTPTGQAGSHSESLARSFIANVRPSIGYKNVFKERHDLDVTLYGEYVQEYSKTLSLLGYGIDPRTPNTPAAITQGNAANQLFATVGGGRGDNAIVSGLVIGRYTLDKKYTLSATYRRDGSSKLPEVNRWAGFFSVGAIWDITRENFMQSAKVNTLRLKVSYGSSGNHNNFPGGNYPYQATYGASGTYAGLPAQTASNPGNDDLKWEKTYVTNIGIDFGFFSNRVYGDLNLYDKTTKDLFVTKRLSATSGFSEIDINAGELQNRGVELSLNLDFVRNRNVSATVFGNFGYNRNRVISLGGESSFEQGTELVTVGLPLGTHYEVRWGGVDAATGAPLYYDASGKLTNDFNSAAPQQTFGTYEAPWKGGFGARVTYKNFELSTLFSWQSGATKSNNLEYFVYNPQFLAGGDNQAKDFRFWQQPGDIVDVPSPLYPVNFSSKYIQSTDFLRWRDLTLAFTLPQTVADRSKLISNARFYIQATNLLIWTKWRGLDPEGSYLNLNLGEFPNPRGITAGLSVTF